MRKPSALGQPTEKVPRPVDLADAASTMPTATTSAALASPKTLPKRPFSTKTGPWYETDAAVFAADVADMFYTEWRVTISEVVAARRAAVSPTPTRRPSISSCLWALLPSAWRNIETMDECHAALLEPARQMIFRGAQIRTPNGFPGYRSWRDFTVANCTLQGNRPTQARSICTHRNARRGTRKVMGKRSRKLSLILQLGSLHNEVSDEPRHPMLATLARDIEYWPSYQGHNFELRCANIWGCNWEATTSSHGIVWAAANKFGQLLGCGWDAYHVQTYGSCPE